MRHSALLAVGCGLLIAVRAFAGVTTISYPNFSSTTGLNLVGSAATVTGHGGQQVLRLTPSTGGAANGTGCPTPVTTAFARFTSSTGGGYENHDTVDWIYTNTLNPFGSGGSAGTVPALSPWGMGALGMLMAAPAAPRERQRHKDRLHPRLHPDLPEIAGGDGHYDEAAGQLAAIRRRIEGSSLRYAVE
jgi:hypothetical protein